MKIQYAEIRWEDGDGGNYMNFYMEDGYRHSYLLEDVLDGMLNIARLQRIEVATRKLIRELNEHHTVRDLHSDVLVAVTKCNREIDAAPLAEDAK